jgi:hypothetical protein
MLTGRCKMHHGMVLEPAIVLASLLASATHVKLGMPIGE